MVSAIEGDNSALTYDRRRTVEWGDSDPAAFINSPRAFDFAVESIEGFYRDVLGLSFLGLLENRRLGAPVVHARCDFKATLRESDTVEMILSIERLGTSSVTWRIDAIFEGKPVFEVCMVSSYIRLEDSRPVSIPEDFRARMQPYLRQSQHD